MNRQEQAEQLRLAAEIIETGHPWERLSKSRGWLKSEVSPVTAVAHGDPISITLATPPDGRPLHNPDDLTAEQVGAGWRLFLPEEVDCKHDGKFELWSDGEWLSENIEGSEYGYTCRIPLSVPWPEAPRPEPALQLPPPPPGIQWHREDGWKKGDLPQGYRPLGLNEQIQEGDEIKWAMHCDWMAMRGLVSSLAGNKGEPKRTTRPLVFTHEGKEWTYHKPGDLMPCDGEAWVESLCDHGGTLNVARAKVWSWNGDIIGWRYTETTKTVPLGPEDVPPGSVVLSSSAEANGTLWNTVTCSKDDGVEIYGRICIPWSELFSHWQINRSIPLTGKWDANAWEPCSKEVPA